MITDTRLRYAFTNENLDAIMAGLDIQPDDRILTVACAGDQAFAFLEIASYVKAVDVSSEQIHLMQQRINQLEKRDYEGFLDKNVKGTWDSSNINNLINVLFRQVTSKKCRKNRDNYFTKSPERLDKIRENLEKLVLVQEPTDILHLTQREEEFSKIYLSNAIIWGRNMGLSPEPSTSVLNRLSSRLQMNGLIYISDNNQVDNTNNLVYLKLDEPLTQAAKLHEHRFWKIGVYRKVA